MTNLKNGDELELKFEMSRPEVAALQAGAQLARRSIAAPVTRRLRSIYFDTPRQDLRAAGISLRLRRVAGHWIQTVKSETALRNGLSNPIEWPMRNRSGREPQLGP
jgi:inorganic triphosphatase YgiF